MLDPAALCQSMSDASDVPGAEALSGPSEPSDTLAPRRADALVQAAESALSHAGRAMSGGERRTLVVHVDARTLVADAPGCSELDDGPVLAAETVRRLGCDASLVAIVHEGGGHVLDVGRRTGPQARTPPPPTPPPP